MITHDYIQMKFVGVLLVMFSVFFPLLKILSSLAYYFNIRGMRENAVTNFFVFKSGKWSMTDVMVVAIFMAYIGFNGIIDSQLGILGSESKGVTVITTNGTSLQPGYYLFMGYAVLALLLSVFLAKKVED